MTVDYDNGGEIPGPAEADTPELEHILTREQTTAALEELRRHFGR